MGNPDMRILALIGPGALAVAAVVGFWPAHAAPPEKNDPVLIDNVGEPSRRALSEEFDQTVFGDARPQAVYAAKNRLNEILARKVVALDRIYGLSETQKQKLKLAGRGDIKRLDDRLESQRQKFVAPRRVVRGNQVIEFKDTEISALRALMKSGPFGDESLFAKAQRTILTPEQVLKYEQRRLRVTQSVKKITIDNAFTLEPISRFHKDICGMVWRRERNEVGLLTFDKPGQICSGNDFRSLQTFGLGRKLTAFDLSRDHNVVAVAENSTKAFVIHLATGQEKALETGNPQPSVAFSPDGKLLATGGYGTKATLWSVASGTRIRDFEAGGRAGGLTPVFSPDGTILAISNRNSSTRLFDVATGHVLRALPSQMSHELKFDPAGKRLAMAYVDGSLAVWTVESGQLLQFARARAEELYSVDWSPDGKMIASSGLNASVTVWDAANLKVLHEIESPEWVIRVCFNPQGTRLFYAGGSQFAGGERYVEMLGVL
jgi:hypothetical protein